jgi:adenosylcobinamide kinase/adenosylcobinamide-phosphate guanylyltransferase
MVETQTSLTLVVGGARSGKSSHAEALIGAHAAPWTYIATAQAFDDEMEERIGHHRARRDGRWRTLDTPFDLAQTLETMPRGAPVLVDCLTLWLSNIMLAERDIDAETRALSQVLVANEVGMGIVPENALARRFRDEAGRLNQMVATLADSVAFTVAGLAVTVK